jgi:hypothetical protein
LLEFGKQLAKPANLYWKTLGNEREIRGLFEADEPFYQLKIGRVVFRALVVDDPTALVDEAQGLEGHGIGIPDEDDVVVPAALAAAILMNCCRYQPLRPAFAAGRRAAIFSPRCPTWRDSAITSKASGLIARKLSSLGPEPAAYNGAP